MHPHTARFGARVSGVRREAPYGPRADLQPIGYINGNPVWPIAGGGGAAVAVSNEELLERLDAAFKAVTDIGSLGSAVLQPQKFDAFVREARDATVILPEARFIRMGSDKVDIDRIGFSGRILRAGRDAANAHVSQSNESDFHEPATATNRLDANELVAVASLRDVAVRRNIERERLGDTLVSLFAEAAGRDLEEYALLADTAIDFGTDDVLSKTDGWLKRAGNKVYGGVGGQFGPAADEFPENMFQTMLEALPKRFLTNRTEWRFWVPFEVEDAYRDILKARGTVLGDTAQEGDRRFAYKGIPVVYAPGLERVGSSDRMSLLSHPDNLAWGVFHEVTVEPEREAKERRTDYVLGVEADADYEDENGAVSAFIDRAAP